MSEEIEGYATRTDSSQSKTMLLREDDRLAECCGQRRFRSDRIARDHHHPATDAIGNECLPVW